MASVSCLFAAELSTDPCHPCGMHRHACTEIVCYLEGSGTLVQKGHKLRYEPGFISIYQPELEHADVPVGAGHQLCIGLSGCGAERLEPGIWKVDDDSLKQCIVHILEEVRTPLKKRSKDRLDILSGWLALELGRLTGNLKRKDTLPDVVKTAKEIFDSCFDETIDLRELAGSLYISPDYFRHIFSKSLGESPLAYLIRRRIECACELLKSTDQPIGEIAARVGLENVYYFSRLFRKRHGMTPTEYRRRSR